MAMITTTQAHLQALLEHAAENATMRVLIKLGKLPATIKQSEAFKLYGRNTVERWVKEGLIEQIQDGDYATIRYDILKLEGVAKASNRWTYLTTQER